MGKRKFILTEEEQKELLQAYRTCKAANTRTRYQAVRLYGAGLNEPEIEQITGCSRTSLMEWKNFIGTPGDTGIHPAQYRLTLTYHRNNRKNEPDSIVLSEAGNKEPEKVIIDVPWKPRNP